MSRFAALGLALTLLSPTIAAQQNVGIYLSRGIVTLTGVMCGFDCNDPQNTKSATVNILDTIDIRLAEQATVHAQLASAVAAREAALERQRDAEQLQSEAGALQRRTTEAVEEQTR